MTTEKLLEIEADRGVVKLWLNRAEKRNALSKAVLLRMLEDLGRLSRDKSARVIVVGSRGGVFCSGHDLSELCIADHEEASEIFTLCSMVMLGLRGLPQPVIARVQGLATAAGCQLVAACDMACGVDGGVIRNPRGKDRSLLHDADDSSGQDDCPQGGVRNARHRRTNLSTASSGAWAGESRGRPGRARRRH